MRLGILIFSKPKNSRFAGVEALETAAKRLGHETVRLYEPFFLLKSDGARIDISYEHAPLAQMDAIIVRPNFCEEPGLHRSVLESLCAQGIPIINGTEGIFLAKNKLLQHLALTQAGIPMPAWAIAQTGQAAREAASAIGFPCVLKVAYGTHGVGVLYVPDKETLLPMMDYLCLRDKNPVIVQRFVKEAQGQDIRAFVLGDKVIAAMQRTAPENEIRSNAARGGIGSSVELSASECELAIRATRVIGLDMAGVDLLRAENGTLVIEVNANPGFEELERATGIDVAGQIIHFAVDQALTMHPRRRLFDRPGICHNSINRL